ncbi:MAG TPA: Fe-S protein assembly co-chaperone HscB [Bryobacteraceae bacterium]|nr:Fe-S protein assembly co-chaperone HscB [Bryobacteraceae bacterium]
MNYFEVFEIPPALALDLKDLETRFYALSRKLHPDLRRNPAERAEAEEATAILNDAYRTLRDPIKRSEYLLKLEGFDIGEQTSKDVPPELLEEVFELNMAIEDADVQQLESARQKFEGMCGEIDDEMHRDFDRWDQTHNREALTAVRGLLNRRKYITNLIEKANVPDRV